MHDPALSDAVVARVLAVHGERGAAWVRQLPRLLGAVAREWALTEVAPPFAAAGASLVAPVTRRDGAQLVLKLAPPSEWVACEARALAHWAGVGAVRLEAADLARGALLLERAVPGTALAAVCYDDDRAATAAAADAIVRLRAAPPPVLGDLPALASWTERLGTVPIAASPPELTAACLTARAVAAELRVDDGPAVVLHGDLHHHNLLSAERAPWLATDPKGLVGPPEAEAAALLRNPRGFVLRHADPAALLADRLDILAERLAADARRLAAWGYVLAVVAALWAFEDQEGGAHVRRWLACADALRAAARARGAA